MVYCYKFILIGGAIDMVKAEYKHPNYSPDKAIKKIIKDDPSHKIIRLEYPDGVIVVFELTQSEIKIHSNYNYNFDSNTNVFSPRLNSVNKDFKDFV